MKNNYCCGGGMFQNLCDVCPFALSRPQRDILWRLQICFSLYYSFSIVKLFWDAWKLIITSNTKQILTFILEQHYLFFFFFCFFWGKAVAKIEPMTSSIQGRLFHWAMASFFSFSFLLFFFWCLAYFKINMIFISKKCLWTYTLRVLSFVEKV